MNTYIYVFLIILVIVAFFALCFLFCIRKLPRQKGKTKFKGEFKLFKLFEFNFEAEHDDSKK